MTEADKAAAASKTSGLSPSALSGAGTGKDSGSAGSTTRSGISGIAGNTAVRTGDKETGIAKIFDADKVQKEIQAQTQITQAFAQQAAQTVDIYAESRMSVLRARYAADPTPENKKAMQSEVDQLRLETQVLNVLIGAVTGNGAAALTRESLAAGAEEMRKITIENSSLPGKIIDESGGKDKPFVLSNTSGESAGGKWDLVPTKTGGTRTNLDNICGADNSRCKTITDENGNKILALKDGAAQWDISKTEGVTLETYIDSKAGQDAAGATGGIQGWKGTLFGIPYAAGSWQDKLIEAFGGSHDFIGGQITGLYDAQGNIARGRSQATKIAQETWSATAALVVASPFAMSDLLPPEVWNAVSIFLRASK